LPTNTDILSLTETWLPPDTLFSVMNCLAPPDNSLINPLQGKGGGIAIFSAVTSKLKPSLYLFFPPSKFLVLV
jgi:hypothetical protein